MPSPKNHFSLHHKCKELSTRLRIDREYLLQGDKSAVLAYDIWLII